MTARHKNLVKINQKRIIALLIQRDQGVYKAQVIKTIFYKETVRMQNLTQNEEQALRDDLEIALTSVANAHGVVVSVGEVRVQHSDNTSETVAVATAGNMSPQAMEAIMEKFYKAHEANSRRHSKHKLHHRLAVAATISVGIYVVYHITKTEMVLKGFEYVIPAAFDKLIFGLGE